MLATVLILSVGIGGTNAPFVPFIQGDHRTNGDKPPPPAPAAAFDQVRAGMTLKEVVRLLGPGFIPAASGTGTIVWSCADGRRLWLSHTSDPKAVFTVGGAQTNLEPAVWLWGRDGKALTVPAKEKAKEETDPKKP